MEAQSLIIKLIKLENLLKRAKLIRILRKVHRSRIEIKAKQHLFQNLKLAKKKKHNKMKKLNKVQM